MNILSFKLVTGEEVIARVNSTEEDQNGKKLAYRISSPQVLQIQQAQGRMGLALMPWALSNPEADDIRLPVESTVVVFSPSSDVEKEYVRQTSKIALV